MRSFAIAITLIAMLGACRSCKLRAADPGDQILCRIDEGGESGINAGNCDSLKNKKNPKSGTVFHRLFWNIDIDPPCDPLDVTLSKTATCSEQLGVGLLRLFDVPCLGRVIDRIHPWFLDRIPGKADVIMEPVDKVVSYRIPHDAGKELTKDYYVCVKSNGTSKAVGGECE
ncbi:hypothetical protein FOZ61_007131 [Perkinsus olseni]|uniref:Uncharacterized protein n=1 Tax=Perkinsus olseni TaxID=32597 RepID=A0A7J6LAJ0_PEROL|nr:hypothetical protein FOZ61_007131 [Perkinsus olseni]